MGDKDIEEQLVALGVPQHVAAYVAVYVAEQRPLRDPLLSNVVFMVVMIGGFAFASLWLWPTLEACLDQNALAAAQSSGALLYYHNFGIGSFIALFAWLGVCAFFVATIPVLSRRLAAGEFYVSVTGAANVGDPLGGRAARWGVGRMQRELESEPDPARYLRRAMFASVKLVGAFAAAALAIAAIVAARELNAYTLYFADRYEQQHTFLPSRTVRAWSDAGRVNVGCRHLTGEDAGDAPIYEVHFIGGGSTPIHLAFPVSMTWIDQVELIDAALVRAGARFEPRLGRREAHDPRCLRAYETWLGAERYARFQRIIRDPELPRDVVPD
jgi:hypothetical protein